MKPTFLVAALALLTGNVSAEFREFTQEGTGKTISAEIRGVNPAAGTVTLALETGSVVNLKQTMLVEADREFIKTWAKENAFATAVRMTATKITGERTTTGGSVYEYKHQENGYRVNVRNGSTTERLDDLTVNYVLVTERAGGKIELKSGSQTVSALAPNGASEFETEKVKLSVDMKSVSSCPKCVKAASEFKGDDLLGVMPTVQSNGKQGAEVVIPSSRDKKRQIREAVRGTGS